MANAGLALPGTLAQHLGLPALLQQHVRLGKVAGAANPDRKALTVIASLLAGGEWVDDVNVLRVGGLGAEVAGRGAARGVHGARSRPSTSGSWTRSKRTLLLLDQVVPVSALLDAVAITAVSSGL